MGADLFLALTEGDNRNVMAAQLGVEALACRKTVAKINDPVRAQAYAHLGITTICRTNLMTTAVLGFLGQAVPDLPGIYAPTEPHIHAEDGSHVTPPDIAPATRTSIAGRPAAPEG